MASIHLGFLMGTAGFSRFVALKRMHAELAQDPSFAARFKHEVMLGARVRHPSVVQVLDVIEWHGELLLVMEFIHGENLAGLVQAAGQVGQQLPVEVVLAVITAALHGLHAAHEASSEDGAPLLLVHRDFSPQNVLVGSDGHSRVLDFGVAKSASQLIETKAGNVAGKVPYMAPEQLRAEVLDRRTDVFSVGVVLWEALTGRRLFGATDPDSPSAIFEVLSQPIVAPSHFRPDIPPSVERAVLRALNRDRSKRFDNARDFAIELEATGMVCGPTVVSSCLQTLCAERLRQLSAQQARAARLLLSAQRQAIADDGKLKSERQSFDASAPLRGDDGLPKAFDSVEGVSPPNASSKQFGRPAAVLAMLVVTTLVALLLSLLPRQPRVPIVKLDQAATPSALSSVDFSRPSPAPQPVALQHVEPAATASVSDPPRPVRPIFSASRLSGSNGHPAPQSSCTPPTYLDDRGIRHFKPQCL